MREAVIRAGVNLLGAKQYLAEIIRSDGQVRCGPVQGPSQFKGVLAELLPMRGGLPNPKALASAEVALRNAGYDIGSI